MQIHRSLGSLTMALTLGCALAATLPAASPFAGKWKFNAAKSKLTGITDSVTAAGPNAWKFTYGTYSWTVKADNTDQPTPFGSTVALKAVNPTTWQLSDKTKGKLTATETWVLAPDGKSMVRTSAGKREDGSAFNDVVTMKRTNGDKGFEGAWESLEVKATWTDVVIADNGDAGITATVPADAVTLPLTFDGKESAATGPRVPAGLTTTTKAAGPRKLEVTSKMNGKILDTETWEVSSDGKTFTYTELDAGEKKATVTVFDKL